MSKRSSRSSKKARPRYIDEPTMSDKTLLLNVEECIGLSFGDYDSNVVNFRMLRTVLHILARQMRLLEQDVEIKFDDELEKVKKMQDQRQEQEEGQEEPQEQEIQATEVQEQEIDVNSVPPGSTADEDDAKSTGKKSKKSRKRDKKGDKRDDADHRESEAVLRQRGKSGSILITEGPGHGDKDKTLVVEKGPNHEVRHRVGSIEIVTREEFEDLEAMVNRLLSKLGPVPFPTMPDNDKLKADMAAGSATLSDVMDALQVTGRVQAAEQALTRMAGLLTQLTAEGYLPEELAKNLDVMISDLESWGLDVKGAENVQILKTRPSLFSRKSTATSTTGMSEDTHRHSTRMSVATATSVSGMANSAFVTQTELEDILKSTRDHMLKEIMRLTNKSSNQAENANWVAKAIAEKLDLGLNLDTRIETLYSTVSDYVTQLSGFDSGIANQLQSFMEQMAMMRSDLNEGLVVLESVNNNAETLAVAELRRSYEGLVESLDETAHTHSSLVLLQKKLCEELKNLMENVELLNEQKADRDEVTDGLRDKADMTRLKGLLDESEFARIREELERRLGLCYDKFNRQDSVWMRCMSDLTNISNNKAEFVQLLALRDDATENLKEIREILEKLEHVLGEPKAALLIRQLARDAVCGACAFPAIMDQEDKCYRSPPPLRPLRQSPADETCAKEITCPPQIDKRVHICKRWAGGSHTLLTGPRAGGGVTRQNVPHIPLDKPCTKQYADYGTDGRLYLMERDLQPCVECNVIFEAPHSTPLPPETGGGDQGPEDKKSMREK